MAAPWDGEVVTTPTGLRLVGTTATLLLDGIDATAEGPVTAGDRLGTATSMWVQVHAPGQTPPRFVPRALADAWRAVVADPSGLLPGEPAAAQDQQFAAIQDPDAVKKASKEDLERQQAAYCKVNYDNAMAHGDETTALNAEGPLGPCRPSVLNAIKKWNASDSE